MHRWFLILLLGIVSSAAQPVLLWSVEFFPEETSHFTEVIQAGDGDYYVSGWAPGLCLFKVDQMGKLLWSYGLDGYDTQRAYWVEELSDGSIAVAGGCLESADNYAIFVVRVNPTGVPVWERVYDLTLGGNDAAYSITELPDGRLAVCGFFGAAGFPVTGEACTMMLDGEGNKLWHRTWGTSYFTNFAIRASYSEGVIRVLAHGTDGGTGAPHILFYSDGGEYLGRARVQELASYYTGHGYPDENAGFTISANGGYTGDPPEYSTLAKMNERGEIAWLTHVVDDCTTMGVSVAGMSSGDYLYGGWETISAGIPLPGRAVTYRGVLYSFDSDGTELWHLPINYGGCRRIDGVTETSSGQIVACGGSFASSFLYCFGDSTGLSDDVGSPPSAGLSVFPVPSGSSVTLIPNLVCQEDMVSLSVYDLSGRLVSIIYEGCMDTGEHWFTWNADVAPGCYIVRLQTSAVSVSRSLVLLE